MEALKLNFVALSLLLILIKQFSCTENVCPAPCLSSLTQKDCIGKGYLVPFGSRNGCCPGCKTGKELNEYGCSAENPCAPGLKCDTTCQLDRSTCSHTYHLTTCKNLKIIPVCDVDGTFAPVQCKGDRITGRCFCTSKAGERIYGWGWRTDELKMTCACSRKKYELINSGKEDNTLHCDQHGNYEPLQCNEGVCWCADPRTGNVVAETRAVPMMMWKLLPCYDATKMGDEYLRQCESALFAQVLIKKSFAVHGTTNVEFLKIFCDYDGAYGPIKIQDGHAKCQWRDGSLIGAFSVSTAMLSSVDCNCARDQKIYSTNGFSHILTCAGTGSYEQQQDINGKTFCVDKDGFALTNPGEYENPDCGEFMWDLVTPPCNDIDLSNEFIDATGTDKHHGYSGEYGSGDYYDYTH